MWDILQYFWVYCLVAGIFIMWDQISSMPGDPERERERRERKHMGKVVLVP